MKINLEESIKLYLRIRSPKIIDEPYYEIDKEKSIFSLKERNYIKTKKNLINLNLNQIFTEENTIKEIYNKSCSNVIKQSLNGCSFCLINHGETTSDKLETLIGNCDDNNINENNKGIFQYLFYELINYIEQNKKKYIDIFLEYSFICVNNSKVIDLNNYFEKDISNLNIESLIENSKLIQNDKSLINTIKKILLNSSNSVNILSFITNIISHFKKNNLDFFSNSCFTIILYINKGINKREINQISTMTFILLNGSEKLNIVENIKLNKNNLDLKKQAINASKEAISTQNIFNSIIYLIKQNKVFNINKLKQKEDYQLTKEEIKEIEINEARYLSNLTSILYKICFDYNIENINYYIYASIFPNIGYYKSVKDSILFLFDLSKILNKNIKQKIKKEKFENLLETDFKLDLETKINQQEQTISALSEICQSKNKKIFNLESEYNTQITKLKKLLGFNGDVQVLLGGEYSPELEKAKNIRESGNKIYALNNKIKSLEKLLNKSKEEIDKYKTNEEIIKNDINMIKYFEGINSVKNDKINNMKKNSFFNQKIISLEKEIKNKNIIINQLKLDLDNKNNIIQNFSKFFDNKKITKQEKNKEKNLNSEKKEEEKISSIDDENIKIKNKTELDIKKIIKNYEKKIKEEKLFWSNQIENKENEIKEMKKKYKINISKEKEYIEEIEKYKKEINILNQEIMNNKQGINYNEKELMKLNEVLMDIIYNYNLYFIHKSQKNINFISLKSKIQEFNIYIREKEREINHLNFPILHTLLEKNNKLSTNYKTKVDRNIKLKLNKQLSYSNILKENKKQNNNIDNNDNNNFNFNSSEHILTKKYLEEMSQKNLVEYCLILNRRIIDVEKYSARFQEINLENEENKKQIIYLKNKLKRVINEAEKINEININNKILINSQNRTIEKYHKNKLNELGINIIDNNNNELITKSLSPRKKLHFNKSQINLKTYNNKNRNKNNKIFLKQKTISKIKK